MEKDFIDEFILSKDTRASDNLLEQRYLGEYIPVQDDASGIWCVQTGAWS